MASKRKVNLNDYDLTTTLGTGKYFDSQLSRDASWFVDGLDNEADKKEMKHNSLATNKK